MNCVLTHGFTKRAVSVAARRPVAAVHPSSRVAIKRLRARLAHVVYAFFVREAPKMAGQVIVLRGRQHFVAKAELSRQEVDSLAALIAELDFSGWSILAGEVDDIIEAAVKDGAAAAFIQTGIDTTADPAVLNIVNKEALDYADARSAEMVGMRRAAGRLIPNPNAKWQITESTRDFIRAEVLLAMEEGWSNDVLATKLADSYAFSTTRSMVIARTETIRASNQGALASYRAADVAEKEWTTAEDDKVSPECVANGEQGSIPIDAAFESGDDAPPAHPNCRCVIVPVVRFASEQTPQEQAL